MEEKEMIATAGMVTPSTQCIAIEGVDCTGKGSITELIERKGIGIPGIKTKRVDFPQYQLPSGQLILNYLNGRFGDASRLLEPVPKVSPDEWIGLVGNRIHNIKREINFIASLYALNRVEYFKLNPMESNTVYVFDRYMFSNAIHQLSLLWWYLEKGEGHNFLKALWSLGKFKDGENVDFTDFVMQNVANEIVDMYENWKYYEYGMGVPKAFTFLLTLDTDTVMERLKKRKVVKHEGDDILERRPAIERSCMFVDNNETFYGLEGVFEVPVKELNEKNDIIADVIIDSYHRLLCDSAVPDTPVGSDEDE